MIIILTICANSLILKWHNYFLKNVSISEIVQTRKRGLFGTFYDFSLSNLIIFTASMTFISSITSWSQKFPSHHSLRLNEPKISQEANEMSLLNLNFPTCHWFLNKSLIPRDPFQDFPIQFHSINLRHNYSRSLICVRVSLPMCRSAYSVRFQEIRYKYRRRLIRKLSQSLNWQQNGTIGKFQHWHHPWFGTNLTFIYLLITKIW